MSLQECSGGGGAQCVCQEVENNLKLDIFKMSNH